MYPVLFQIGPITIYSLGIFWALGALAAVWILQLELKRYGYNAELASMIVMAAAIGGLVGARLLFIVEEWEHFTREPLSLLLSGSGFSWFGGLLGGGLTAAWSIRKNRLPFWEAADMSAPALALAYGIGRIGCFLAGDATWGKISDVPWAMSFPNAVAGWVDPLTGLPYSPGVRVHPTQLYELVQSLIVFAILWSLRTRKYPSGDAIFSLSDSRRIDAICCGILACEPHRGCRFDGVPVDESGTDHCRNWTALLSNKGAIQANTAANWTQLEAKT